MQRAMVLSFTFNRVDIDVDFQFIPKTFAIHVQSFCKFKDCFMKGGFIVKHKKLKQCSDESSSGESISNNPEKSWSWIASRSKLTIETLEQGVK